MSRRRLALLAVLGSLLAGGCDPPEPLEFSEARIRAVIPGQDKTVGYFTVRNHTGKDIALTGVRSARAGAIEMHVTERDGDIARMRRLQEVVVPAGETVRFEPGGRHLMLFRVGELGEITELTLETRDGAQYAVPFETITLGDE